GSGRCRRHCRRWRPESSRAGRRTRPASARKGRKASAGARAASCLEIRLGTGIGGGEGVKLHAGLVNPLDGRKPAQIEGIAVAVEDLRHKRDVGETGAVAMAKGAGAVVAGQK